MAEAVPSITPMTANSDLNITLYVVRSPLPPPPNYGISLIVTMALFTRGRQLAILGNGYSVDEISIEEAN